MINKSKKIKFLGLMLVALGFVLVNGAATKINAQQTRDPFANPPWIKKPAGPAGPTTPGVKGDKPAAPVKVGPSPVGIPAIQDRINYYKKVREDAVNRGVPIPKVTSVLTIDEMSVMGIVRTPRGMAAMIEATPIKLSYTIYPGEKFFNGQLVAIEDNKLVFRKVVKMSDGKFIASEENKTLRQYTVQEEVQGTAPVEQSGKTETAKTESTPPAQQQPVQQPAPTQPSGDQKPAPVTAIVSPLDEMNKQPAADTKTAKGKTSAKDKKGKDSASSTKKGKKPVKVAENKEQ